MSVPSSATLEEALIIGRCGYVPLCRLVNVTNETSPYTTAEWKEAARAAYSETSSADSSPLIESTPPGLARATTVAPNASGDSLPSARAPSSGRQFSSPTPGETRALGWSIVPLNRKKRPFIKWEYLQHQQPTPAEITEWERDRAFCCWGTVTGKISGAIVLDFDGQEGASTMRKLGFSPDLQTPSGGYHVRVEHPGGYIKTLSAKSDPELRRRFPGMDVRGDGGYAVFSGEAIIKGSNPPKCGPYVWLRDPTEPPAPFESMPGELQDFLRDVSVPAPSVKPPQPNGHNRQGRVDNERLIRDALAMVAGGQGRNDTGAWLAVQGRDNGYSKAEVLAFNWHSHCPGTNAHGVAEPYTAGEWRATVESIFSRPARKPWGSTRESSSETREREAPGPEPQTEEPRAAEAASNPKRNGQQEESSSRFQWPDPIAEEAFHGTAGEVVKLLSPHSEADPAALLVQFLADFGSICGRHAYFVTDGAKQHSNLYVVIVGPTAKARKGTAWNQAFRIARQIDEEWAASRVMSGLSTGEGVIWAVRDAIHERSPIKEKGRITGYEDVEFDPGIADKRLHIFEPEFARVLKATERDSNTLSPVMREAFDTGNLNILTKKQAARSTDAHISFVTHVTKDELRRLLTETSIANGLANRHLFVCARRSKLLPEGGALDEVDFTNLIQRLQRTAAYARTAGQIQRDDEARAIWRAVYGDLSEGKPGMFGAITSRGDVLAVRLSLIYALLDSSPLIRAVHLKAALAVVNYGEASARFIFGDSLGDETADEILRQLRARPDGVTRTEVRDYFQRNRTAAEIGRALGVLQEYGLARFERSREQEDQTRRTERWFAITASSSTEARH